MISTICICGRAGSMHSMLLDSIFQRALADKLVFECKKCGGTFVITVDPDVSEFIAAFVKTIPKS